MSVDRAAARAQMYRDAGIGHARNEGPHGCVPWEEHQRVLAERDALYEANMYGPDRWTWNTLVLVARQILDEHYPADVFTGESGDPGAVFVHHLRTALSVLP